MSIDNNKIKAFEEQVNAIELMYNLSKIDHVKAYEEKVSNIELMYNLSKSQIEYYILSIERYEEKERKCQNSIFYRNFYKRVQKAQIEPLYQVINTYGAFCPIAKPINEGDLDKYIKALSMYSITLSSMLPNMSAFENRLKNIVEVYKNIYRIRIKSWFYCVMFDM